MTTYISSSKNKYQKTMSFCCFFLAAGFVASSAQLATRRFVCTGSEFFQNIAFRVDGKQVFNCKKSGVAHLAARGVQATNSLGQKGVPRKWPRNSELR